MVGPAGSAKAEEIDELRAQTLVNSYTDKPESVNAVSSIVDGDVVHFAGGSSVKMKSLTEQPIPGYKYDREDGVQLISVNSARAKTVTAYEFKGHQLLLLADGSVLVNSADSGETVAYIDPPWSRNKNAIAVPTHYEVRGDTLIQVVDNTNSDSDAVADPYIRDITYNGRKTGQEMVFSTKETGLITAGGTVACAEYAGWFAVGCAVAPAVASYALSRNNCLAIRALGSPHAPNVIFPVSTRC